MPIPELRSSDGFMAMADDPSVIWVPEFVEALLLGVRTSLAILAVASFFEIAGLGTCISLRKSSRGKNFRLPPRNFVSVSPVNR